MSLPKSITFTFTYSSSRHALRVIRHDFDSNLSFKIIFQFGNGNVQLTELHPEFATIPFDNKHERPGKIPADPVSNNNRQYQQDPEHNARTSPW